MRKSTRAYEIVRIRKIMLGLAILFTLIMSIILFTNKADAETNRQVYTYYTSYEIKPGDTLWTIADQFMGPDFTDKEDFIQNIKSMNHLSTDEITYGKFLVIEYSSYDELDL